MLRSTFIHVPGIGPKTERRFWESGLTDWDCFCDGYRGRLRTRVLELLDAQSVLERLPRAEMWRLYPRFRDQAVFLDIETTGLYGEVTCIGIWDGQTARSQPSSW